MEVHHTRQRPWTRIRAAATEYLSGAMHVRETYLPVEDGELHALRFGEGPRVAVGLHGITASAMAFPVIARNLPDDWTLLALDLRGRGRSADLPGPYGLSRHAADTCQVAARLGADPVVLVGHSMGAYVAVLAAAACPDRFGRVILVDGGLPDPPPEGADPDEVLAQRVGPALVRLRMTFADEQAYLDFFRAHPAFTHAWSDDVEAYVRYDLTGSPGAMRSRARQDAVREDGRDLLLESERIGAALMSLRMPTLLLTAPSGTLGKPPGLLGDELVAHWRRTAPHLRIETVPETNHYTLTLGSHGAATIARRIADPSSWPPPRDHLASEQA
jgi:pimeloyl-ACP methyl ester carboxylesterase